MKRIFTILLTLIFGLSLSAQDSIDEALAYQYYQQGDFEKAAPLLEELFTRTKNDNYFELYFTSLIKVKKYQEAENFTKRLIRQNPTKTQYIVALGRVYQELGKNEEANNQFNEAIKNAPKTEFSYRDLANNFYQFEAYDMAVETFLQGRKALGGAQYFTLELLSIYRFKKNKTMLVTEYVNALSTMPQLLQQAQSGLASVFENKNDYQLLQAALLKKIQKEPEVEVYTELLIWQFIQQQEYEMALRQLIAFDKRTKGDGLMIYNTANTFLVNKAFATAQKAFEYLLTKGPDTEVYVSSKIQLINVKYELVISGQIDKTATQQLALDYQEVVTKYGINVQTLFAVKKLAQLKAYYLNDLLGAEKTLEEAAAIRTLSAADIGQLKIDLGDIYVLTNQPWEAVLIYEQVAKQFENQNIGNEAKFKSTKLSYYQGNFTYAKSQADVLKASTSQLIANDALNLSLLISDNLQSKNDSLALKMYADAEMLEFVNNYKAAISKLDSIPVKYPSNSLADDILKAKSKIFIKQNELSQAADALKSLIDNEPQSIWVDDALFELADLLEKKLNKVDEAKKLYERLINEFPGSMFASEARKRFRNIRGDNLGS